MTIDKELLDILCCPECKGELSLQDNGLACRGCNLLYPIKEGIPVMLVDEARPLDKEAER